MLQLHHPEVVQFQDTPYYGLEAHDPVADEWVSLEPPTVVFGNDGVALAHPHMRTLVNNAADGMLVLDSGCADSKGLGRRLTARAGGPLTTGSSK